MNKYHLHPVPICDVEFLEQVFIEFPTGILCAIDRRLD